MKHAAPIIVVTLLALYVGAYVGLGQVGAIYDAPSRGTPIRVYGTWVPTRVFVPLAHLEASVRGQRVHIANEVAWPGWRVDSEEYIAEPLW